MPRETYRGLSRKNLSDPSDASEPIRPCNRCRIDATADPCAPCPLYFGWLERLDLADDATQRIRYAAWVGLGGWPLLWALHGIRLRREERLRLLDVLTVYPGALRRRSVQEVP
jgi:hypothetical protein